MGVTGDKLDIHTNTVIDIDVDDGIQKYGFFISDEIEKAKSDLVQLQETIDSVAILQPSCDKTDYILAACSGAICGIIDIFLVGKPGESPIGEATDKWFEERTKAFARMYGWTDSENSSFASAVRKLEKEFHIPYDQRAMGIPGNELFQLDAKNHHFKSLGHNPSLMGLFFSILDQFANSSHFVGDGIMVSLEQADDTFELRGHNVPAKFFCGLTNWFGHLISDNSGSSGSKGRGMGLPSPIWAWVNDIIVVRQLLHIPPNEFIQSINELAVNIFKKGFDLRFQTTQLIPVIINELVVRLFYATRRMVQYYVHLQSDEFSFSALWKKCEPFSNPTVKRMLTVAHGTFCAVDLADATGRAVCTGAGTFNVTEFLLRLNIAGIGRFTVSLYGEATRGMALYRAKENKAFAEKQYTIIENYLNGLEQLSRLYDDKSIICFIDDLKNSDLYIEAFDQSIELARMRMVPEEKILLNKTARDVYFRGR